MSLSLSLLLLAALPSLGAVALFFRGKFLTQKLQKVQQQLNDSLATQHRAELARLDLEKEVDHLSKAVAQYAPPDVLLQLLSHPDSSQLLPAPSSAGGKD